MKTYSLQAIVAKVSDLYSIPEAAIKARRMLSDPDVDIDSLVRVVSNDQGLSGRVLRIANSSFYARTHPLSSVKEAVMTIGLRNMQNVVTAHIVKDFSSRFGSAEYVVWEHSLAVAVIAMTLAEKTRAETLEDAMLGGILHDVGKTVLCTVVPDEYNLISDAVYQKNLPAYSVESAVFGFNHANVGALLSQSWNFPEKIGIATAYHHMLKTAHTKAPDHLGLVCLIDLANRYARLLGFSLRPPPESVDWSKVASARALKLSPQVLDDMHDPLLQRIEEERSIFD